MSFDEQGPDERWSPLVLIVRGSLYTVSGAGISWWAWPEPTSSGAMAIFVYFGMALLLFGCAMATYGVIRAALQGSVRE